MAAEKAGWGRRNQAKGGASVLPLNAIPSNIVEASGGWKNIILVNAQNPENAKYQGRSIASVAKELKKDPADTAFDLVVQGTQGRVLALYYMMSEQDIDTALRFLWTSIGSDAGVTMPSVSRIRAVTATFLASSRSPATCAYSRGRHPQDDLLAGCGSI